ncbi:hypothetical protein L6452_08599 [Arctium lappa]|uniref:Uncharacterized protein n=1 Tax=Arctium lappa TaxID=4217 RepID=A0ACB9DI59_ARCLA|nr:hypothetical protein L6452_08599 [Arctium lappa]
MSGDKNPSPIHRAYAITNIKTYVPLILDLTARNYDPWRDLFTAHCIAYDVLDHIDDSYDAPNKPPTDLEWEKLDAMVKLWLFGSISQSLITSVHSTNATARKIWLNIDALFCENKDAPALQLESELRTISMGDLSVHDYCTKVKKIADLLEGLGEKVKEKHVVIHAINGLSSKFDGVANIIRHSKPFPTFSEMRSMLGVEEQRLLSTRVPSPSHDHHSSAPSLLHVGNSSSTRGGGNHNNFRRNDRRGGHNNFNRRRPSLTNTTGAPPSRNNHYGWVYFPPPTPQQQPLPTSSWG